MSPVQTFRQMSLADRPSVSRYRQLARSGLSIIVCFGCAASGGPPASRPAPVTQAPTPIRDFVRIESEVLAALNRARTDPGGTASALEALIPHFSGTRFKRPTWPVPVQTTEGATAVREAVRAVRSQRPLNPLTLSPGLSRSARDHVGDQSRSGGTGHVGADGSSTPARAARYGTWQVSFNENIDYGPMVEGRDVVESLLIDDGVPDRGHRRNIFEPASKVVGIACGPHPRFTAMCVIVQAGGFVSK